jgi:hypothetical protein
MNSFVFFYLSLFLAAYSCHSSFSPYFHSQVSELSLVSAMNALKFAQVVLLVVENTQGKFSKLDLQIARKCLDEGRALVIAANKGDLAFFMGIGPR